MIIAMVDDDAAERNKNLPIFLNGFQESHIPVVRFDLYSSGESFLRKWTPGAYDLVILDIIMGKYSGMEVAARIRETDSSVRLVFCSTSNEYASESYDVGANYYLQKPLLQANVFNMIRHLNIADFDLRRFVILPDNQKLLLRGLIYSEYHNHRITFFMKDGTTLKSWMAQTKLEELLEPFDFLVSCTKGIFVNLHEVQELEGDAFLMTNGASVPISRRKKKEMESYYREFLFSSLREDMA